MTYVLIVSGGIFVLASFGRTCSHSSFPAHRHRRHSLDTHTDSSNAPSAIAFVIFVRIFATPPTPSSAAHFPIVFESVWSLLRPWWCHGLRRLFVWRTLPPPVLYPTYRPIWSSLISFWGVCYFVVGSHPWPIQCQATAPMPPFINLSIWDSGWNRVFCSTTQKVPAINFSEGNNHLPLVVNR